MMKIRSSFPYFDEESIKLVLRDINAVLKEGLLSLGPYTQEFERRFCEYTKAKRAVAVNSGATSLEIPLRYFNIKNRDVIVPTNTFVATPNSVVFAGGHPVFADMREDTLCINPDDVRRRITPKTAGIIVVHIAGLVCPQIYELKKICADNNLFLLEDCAHVHGAMIDGKMAGTIGDAGCFSCAPTKNIPVGEGGIMITDNDGLAEAALILRNRGLDSNHLMVSLGSSWIMSETTAILGIHQMETLGSSIQRRNELARLYEEQLEGTDGLSLFRTPSNVLNAYHKFPVRFAENFDVEKIAIALKKEYGVETSRSYYPPCHLHPYYMETFETREGDFPVAERVQRKVLTLPIHPVLTDAQVIYVSNAVKSTIYAQKK
jgi:perosamine synthetase